MRNPKKLQDRIARVLLLGLTVFCALIVAVMALGLYLRARPVLALKPLSELLLGSSWHPLRKEFGFLPFIVGSCWVTGIALLIAVPLCLLTAIYLSEYARPWIRGLARPLIDLLAGIPSVVYGVWGILVIVPWIKNSLGPLAGTFTSGYCTLAAGIVLAVMVLPIIIHVMLEVFQTVPAGLKEASLSLGATRWQTVKHVLVRKSRPGILAAIVLGLSRAFGETMAVLMVAGNVARLPNSVLEPCYPLPALIANNYGEMLSVPLYDAAIMLASLILLLVVLLFNILARIVLVQLERNQ